MARTIRTSLYCFPLNRELGGLIIWGLPSPAPPSVEMLGTREDVEDNMEDDAVDSGAENSKRLARIVRAIHCSGQAEGVNSRVSSDSKTNK